MPDDMRDQLELAARNRAKRKPSWNLSQEILHRLGWSLHKEREDRRDVAMQALCHVISQIGRWGLHTYSWNNQSWHRDPYMFRAFRLAVDRVLEALQPAGEIRPTPDTYGWDFETPEELARYAARSIVYRLFHDKPFTGERKTEMLEWARQHKLEFGFPAYQGELYDMARARRHLGIKEPGEGKMGEQNEHP